MKKLLAFLLAITLLLTFAACGTKDIDDDKKDKDKTAAAVKGDEDGGKFDDDTASDKDDKDEDEDEDEEEDKDKEDNSSSEGAAWDDDYYNNVFLHWTEALDVNDYTNFTLTMDVKSEQLGDSTQVMKVNGNVISISSDDSKPEVFTDAEATSLYKKMVLGVFLDILNSTIVEYDYKTQLYTSSIGACEFSMEDVSAYITAYDIEFYIDKNMHLTHLSCRMEQELTSSSGAVTNLSLENVTVALSDFGTTK